MRIFKVTAPVSMVSRRVRRSFEKDEKVAEIEIEMLVEHFRKCFEPEPDPVPAGDPIES